MRLLVLGGTVFCSREVAAQARARGHEVTAACRGTAGTVPDGVRLVAWDRAGPAPADLAQEKFDAVVDVARLPSWVRRDVAVWPEANWVLVSTISVYADQATPGGTPATLPLVEPQLADVPLDADPTAYGSMKVACEQALRAGARSSTVVRPGLIAGPGDPSGRFTSWPHRLAGLADGEEVLAPGTPADSVQVVDVRDLAAWLVDLAERRVEGTYDGVGPVQRLDELLTACACGVGAHPRWTWVTQGFLEAQGVRPWSGPDAIPLWLPRPAYDGMLAHDPAPSTSAGLTCRPLVETAAATAAWLAGDPQATVTGISRERELALLEVFHAG